MSGAGPQPPVAPAEPSARVLAGRYELGDLLGSGGMADVRRARDRVLGRDVAVKLLRDSAGDETDRARFIGEARTLAGLSHSGLVVVLDAGFGTGASTTAAPADRPFLVMELVDGPTLAQRLDGPMAPADVGAIGVQLAEALAYVHRHGIVHRDVKPGNVLLGAGGRVKLADFGIARLLADAARHTRTGQAIGTAAYLAPEQVTGREVSGASDVYSLGLVLLEALTGHREYPGSPTEAAMARLHRDPEVPADLPATWRDLLLRMTAQEPGSRPDAAEVADLLRHQPTGPVPIATEAVPDALTTPLLATGAPADPGSTRVVTEARPVPDRAGDALARRATRALQQVRGLAGRAGREAVVALAVLVLFLVVVALVGGGGGASDDLPAGTPPSLEEPLRDLHDAVHGEDR